MDDDRTLDELEKEAVEEVWNWLYDPLAEFEPEESQCQ